MRPSVKKRGNSTFVCFPRTILRAANLHLDEAVNVREESGRIIIEPFGRRKQGLAELLDGITNENLRNEIDFAKPLGKEAW